MKKVIIFFMVVLALCMPVFAEETTTEETTTASEETTTETLVETTVDNPDKIDDEATVDSFIDKISTSSIWITVASVGGAALAIIGIVTKKFGNIFELIKSKADTKTITDALKDTYKEISEEFLKEFKAIKERLETSEDNNKKLTTALSLFMINAKISTPAKTEILKYLNGIKTVSGEVSEEIDKAIKVIEEAEALEEKPVTPVLDKITEETHIALG